MKKSLLLLIIICTLSSCMKTKTTVGKFKEMEGTEYVHSRTKQMWLFWGFLPLGRSNAKTPEGGNCQIITKFTFVDALISGLTGGFFTTYTIRVKAKK